MNEYQNIELDILKEIIYVLKEHNLTYYAIGGTCIGAIRHKGFIPWDDDIDIALPRKDYELFRTKLWKELPDYLKLLDYDTTESNNFLFSKIHDIRTTMIDSYAKDDPERYTGAFVDIMPVDGLPNDKEDAIDEIHRYNDLIRMNNIIRGARKEFPYRVARRLIKSIHSYNYYTNKLFDRSSSFIYGNSDFISFTWRPEKDIGLKRVMFNYIDFETQIEVPFEDIMISVPSGFDNYLRQDFGDYMKLPAIEDRNSGHDRYIYDCDKSYRYYAELKKRGDIK